MNNVSIFDKCSSRMVFTILLSLQYNDLTALPKLGSLFPNLRTLDLSNNLLHFINRQRIAGLSSLTTMYINHNRFSRIPSAINVLSNLLELHLKSNRIETIGDYDLLRNRNFTILVLRDNPLVYISDIAFHYNVNLNLLDLQNILLRKVPRALLRLRHLGTVYQSGLPINCSCQSMSYLKTWNVKPVHLYASCSSGESVKRFLT